MEARVLSSASPAATHKIDAICQEAGVNVKDCYQCGKCSAGCPAAAFADLTPREVIRKLQLGLYDDVIAAKMPWLCVECGMCYARCPQSVDLPNLMNALRKAARAEGSTPIREIPRFDKIFVDGVRARGTSDEALLAMQYNLTTGHLFQDVLGAPKMLSLGLLNTKGHKVEGSAEVKAIIDKVRAQSGTAGGAGKSEQGEGDRR